MGGLWMGTFNVRRLTLNALPHVVYEWRSEKEPRGTMVLLHGYMDAAGTWDLVAERVAAEGFVVLAPHLRGFGEGPRIGEGTYYHFPDYVLDTVVFLETLGDPVHLVGHSMGGTIAGLVAGSTTGLVRTLALLEGVGPPTTDWDDVPDRTAGFVDDMKKWAGRPHRPMASVDEAIDRLRVNHPSIDRAVLATRVPHLVTASESGVTWRFDPRHRVRSAFPFYAEAFKAHLRRIACPTLFVGGGSAGYHPSDEADRIRSISRHARGEIPEAGHMMHWTRPEELARVLVKFASD